MAICGCPPKWSNETVGEGWHSWDNDVFDNCGEGDDEDEEEYLVGTSITYSCPMGHVFETPELLETGDFSLGLNVITLTCEQFSVWIPHIVPKCVPINCTDEPMEPANNPFLGIYDWDPSADNRTFMALARYQ